MTLQDIRAMDKEFITPDTASRILGCDPQYIRVTAREAKEDLGFPVVLIKSRVKIPRKAFIQFMEGVLSREHS